MKIHPSAIVDKKAKLADDVEIGPYSIIGPDVKIGAGTVVGSHCVIDGWTAIGKKCSIFTGAAIGGISQDKKFEGEKSFVEIGDNNSIREYVTVNRGTGKGSVTKIGNDNLIMAYCHVAHNCEIQNSVVLANACTLAGYVTIENKAILGGMAGVHQFVRIGQLAIIGGCSKVVRHVAPYAMADGNPAKVYGLNVIGLKRAGISGASRLNLKRAFKLLFNSGLSVTHALKKIEASLPKSTEMKVLIQFLTAVKSDAQRGVCV